MNRPLTAFILAATLCGVIAARADNRNGQCSLMGRVSVVPSS